MTTNYERIKNMSIDEMAELFAKNFSCKLCLASKPRFNCNNCIDQIGLWLSQEVEE